MPITVEREASGRLVACKWASGSAVARLRHEGEMLDRARHPGVVELLDVRIEERTASLRMAAAAGPSLDRAAPMEAAAIAGLVAAVASTLADLHATGVVHGAIEPAHIVIDGDGRPLVCGLADARAVGDDPEAAAGDVAALGQLLRQLLGRVATTRPDGASEILSALAAWAAAPEWRDRPTASQLATEIVDRVTGARLPRVAAPLETGDPLPQEPVSGRARRSHVVVAVAAAALVVGTGSVLVSAAPGARDDAAAEETAPTATGPVGAPPASRGARLRARATRVWPSDQRKGASRPVDAATSCASTAATLHADVDGDGCAETLEFAGGIVGSGPARWAVGEPGDVAVTGRWQCEGGAASTLAVLRRRDGSVWVFARWPSHPGEEEIGERWGLVPGADGLRRRDVDGDGCDELAVDGPEGATVLRPPGARS